MKETAKYKIVGLVDMFDEQGVITGQYPIGSVQELEVEVGVKAVEEGRAEAVAEGDPSTVAEAPTGETGEGSTGEAEAPTGETGEAEAEAPTGETEGGDVE